MAGQARTEMGVETLDAVADRGYYDSQEIRACEDAGITVTLPKPMTSGAKAAGRFGKQEGGYLPFSDINATKRMKYTPGQGVSVFKEHTNQANGLTRDLQGRLVACEGETRRVTGRKRTAASR
jgi:hypothetical protein